MCVTLMKVCRIVIYHDNNFDDLPKVVNRVVRDLKPDKDKFDSIVVIGLSGIVVGTPVSLKLGKPIIIIRKDRLDNHQKTLVVNGSRMGNRYLFLDDFVSTGKTVRKVRDTLSDSSYAPVQEIGQYLYATRSKIFYEIPMTIVFDGDFWK